MKKLLVITLLAGFLLSCGTPQGKQTEYTRDGVSFTVPAGWKVVEQEDIGAGTGYYLAMEKQGADESGTVTVSWINGDMAQRYYEINKEELANTEIFSNFFATDIPSSMFGKFQAQEGSYTMDIMGLKHSGNFYVFAKGGRTFCVMMQEADEDHDENLAGFDIVKSSFRVE